MKRLRKVGRRSFLASVVGGAVIGSVLLVSDDAQALQSGCSDTDPISNGGDPGGRGRNCQNRPRTGCSDRDPSDPGGSGRNCSAATGGCSDRDPSDPAGRGRSCGNSNPAQQRCAADRSRTEAIQQQLSQFPYWTDDQINAAGQTYDATVGYIARARSEGAENEVEGVEGHVHLPGSYASALESYGVSTSYAADDAVAELRRRIDQALAARGQRQALEREFHSLQQRIAANCG